MKPPFKIKTALLKHFFCLYRCKRQILFSPLRFHLQLIEARLFLLVEVHLHCGEYWQPKNGKDRVVPISSALRQYLISYNPIKCRWHPDNFSEALRSFSSYARLTCDDIDSRTGKPIKRPCNCLDFRHTFGSHLAMKGETLLKISEIMVNSPEICRKHYAR